MISEVILHEAHADKDDDDYSPKSASSYVDLNQSNQAEHAAFIGSDPNMSGYFMLNAQQ